MKRFFIALATLLVAVSANAAKEKKAITYVDASTLTIINKIHDKGNPFERLDVERYGSLTKTGKKVFTQSTGLALVFSTDSRNIHARWSVHSRKFVANCNEIYARGLDIYIRHEGKWTFAGVAKPSVDPNVLDFESPFSAIKKPPYWVRCSY